MYKRYLSKPVFLALCTMLVFSPVCGSADTTVPSTQDVMKTLSANNTNPKDIAEIKKQLNMLLSQSQGGANANKADQTKADSKSAAPVATPAVPATASSTDWSKSADASDDTDLQSIAFSQVVSSMLPLTPGEVKVLRRRFNESQQAAAFTEDTPPRPTSTSMVVNLSPGATPPIVRLSSGFVTSLLFVDATGAPWPIKAYDIGNPKAFNIQWNQSGKGADSSNNTLLIQAVTMYKQGNLAVMLKGLNTPVMITLLPGQRAIDYRVDMQVPRMGPNAMPQVNYLPMVASPALLDVLNGIPPKGGKRLHVAGGELTAWLKDRVMYVRTPYTVVSPNWISTMTGADGTMHAYEMAPTSVVLALRGGKMVKMTLEGF